MASFAVQQSQAIQGGAAYGVGPGGRGLNGALPPGSGRVANPADGVAPGEIKRARHNSGSNICVPYARVVSALQKGDEVGLYALPTLRDKDHHDYRAPGRPCKLAVHENEGLSVGNIAFVRGKGATREEDTSSGGVAIRKGPLKLTELGEDATDRPPRSASAFSSGMTGHDTLSRMCDLEYLSRFFECQHYSTVITLPSEAKLGPSPFLTTPVDTSDGTKLGDWAKKRYDDEVWTQLYNAMDRAGLFTWRPDGIVKGKDHTGVAEEDAEFDRRLHQLFNVAVQGPAVTTDLCNRAELACLPNDRVFVLIKCDVVSSDTKEGEGEKEKTSVDIEEARRRYKEQRQTINNTVDRIAVLRSRTSQKTDPDGELNGLLTPATSGKRHLENFRVVLTTSAQLMRDSGMRQNGAGPHFCRGGDTRCRLGMGKSPQRAEYVLGGWSLGKVLDSAATRPFTGMPMRAVSTPHSAAVNVYVHVKWWSGGELHAAFHNEGGKRFHGRGDSGDGPADWQEVRIGMHRELPSMWSAAEDAVKAADRKSVV